MTTAQTQIDYSTFNPDWWEAAGVTVDTIKASI